MALIILLFPAVFEVNKMVNSIEDVFEVVFRCYFYVASQQFGFGIFIASVECIIEIVPPHVDADIFHMLTHILR